MRNLGDQQSDGGILGRAAIARRVARGEIISASTYSEQNLRGAGYDLRIARDMLMTPDRRRYGPGESESELQGSFVLKPGETAFVTTLESIHLPWDVVANIAPKYSFARRGLFVFSGVIVDPGYGMEYDTEKQEWRPRKHERLHFLITNLSDAQKELHPLQVIASLQFFCVDEVPEPHRKEINGAIAVWRDIREGTSVPIGSLGFFSGAAERTELSRLQDDLHATNSNLAMASATTERVVVFGLYVLAAALLGMTLTALIAILDNPHHVITLNLRGGFSDWDAYLFLALAFALVFIVVVSPIYWFRGLWGARPHRVARPSHPPSSS